MTTYAERQCTNHDGSRKRGWTTKRGAKDQLKFIRRRTPAVAKGMNVYECDNCGLFHLGHMGDYKKRGE